MANLAPYFFLRLNEPHLASSEIALSSWGELRGADDADAWWSQTPREQWIEELRPLGLEELLGRLGLLRISRADWEELIAPTGRN